jgi:hypothetical protein
MKISYLPLVAAILLPLSTANLAAQQAGTYNMVTAGKTLQETGYGALGTLVIGSDNKSVTVTVRNYLKPTSDKYTGKLGSNPFTLADAKGNKLRIRIAYSSAKAIFGYYEAFRNSQMVGTGEYAATRR